PEPGPRVGGRGCLGARGRDRGPRANQPCLGLLAGGTAGAAGPAAITYGSPSSRRSRCRPTPRPSAHLGAVTARSRAKLPTNLPSETPKPPDADGFRASVWSAAPLFPSPA